MPYNRNAKAHCLTVSAFIVIILTTVIFGAGQWLLDTIMKALLAVAIGAFLRWTWKESAGKLLQKDN